MPNLFRCPICRGEIAAQGKDYSCTKCAEIFPSIKGVIHLVGQKKFVDLQKNETDRDISVNSSRNWDFQWKKAVYSQEPEEMAGNYFLTEGSLLRFIKIKRSEYKNKKILVLGCGNGKEVFHILGYEPKTVVAVDISSSVYNVREKFKLDRRLLVVRADAMDFPFSADAFDIIISDRALDQVKDWTRVFEDSYKCLRKEGLFACSMISKENNGIFLYVIQPSRKLFRSLPLKVLYYLSFPITVAAKITALAYTLLDKANLGLPLREHFLFWNRLSFSYLWRGVIFDILHAPLTHAVSRDELVRVAGKAGFKKINISAEIETLWSMRATKD